MKDTRKATKDILIRISLSDKCSDRSISDIMMMTWNEEVGLEKILDHVIDAIERIEV